MIYEWLMLILMVYAAYENYLHSSMDHHQRIHRQEYVGRVEVMPQILQARKD